MHAKDLENEMRNEYLSRALQDLVRHWRGQSGIRHINTHWSGVFKRALAIFDACDGGFGDFYLQYADYRSLIFGGYNRLFWDRRKSEFRASEDHCTPKFLKRFEELKTDRNFEEQLRKELKRS